MTNHPSPSASADDPVAIAFTLNNTPVTIHAAPDRRVIDLLREDLGLTGSKEGCGTGECGACTILVDDEPRLACLMLAAQLAGRSVETVESLEASPQGRVLLDAFETHGAVQCGYCTPGMEMTAQALLRRQPAPDRDTVRRALSGNLCRCTGYVKIIDSVTRAGVDVKADA
jgi:carbon-monoxide dehydrogenase small subunit